jgi:hypothetical protein
LCGAAALLLFAQGAKLTLAGLMAISEQQQVKHFEEPVGGEEDFSGVCPGRSCAAYAQEYA